MWHPRSPMAYNNKYDPFRFMDERQAGKLVSESDCNKFQMFNTCRYLSMNPNMRKCVQILNDLQAQKLPKDLQARAFNAFNGMRLNLRWCRAKTETVREKDEFIEKAMAITGMTKNCVKAALRHGIVNKEWIEEAYMKKYEPEKLRDRMLGEERTMKRASKRKK